AQDQGQLQRILEDCRPEAIDLIVLCNQDNQTKPNRARWPFRVAVDTGQREGASKSHTASMYNVTKYPATVIIDRTGRVVRTLTGAPCVEDIEQALNTRASWRKAFDWIYSLGPDEVVKCVKPPFVSVREQYLFSHPYGVAASALPTKTVFAWQDGKITQETSWRGSGNIISRVLDGMAIDNERDYRFLLNQEF
ncbi:MAG: hypothetical protein GY809_31460, partial [Planctomycetes bacterium]|nr:hypothetical protein [Planctomycetota bacterium]